MRDNYHSLKMNGGFVEYPPIVGGGEREPFSRRRGAMPVSLTAF